MDYIAYGLHLWYKIQIFKEICRKPIPLPPGLGSSLQCVWMPPVQSYQGQGQGRTQQGRLVHHALSDIRMAPVTI